MLFGIKNLDISAKNFHFSEDVLEVITNAIGGWISLCLENRQDLEVMEWLHSIKTNQVAYELAYACIYYFIPYFLTRSALKWNKSTELEGW